MKKAIYIVILLLFAKISFAQYYYIPWANANTNPNGINTDPEYPVGGGILAGWTTIQAPAAVPTWSPSQTIPFAFSFNGTAATNYKVSTSGVLTFDVASALAAPSYVRAALPNANIPNSSVCIWGLNALGTNDNIVAKTLGTAPNRQHWIQFTSYGYNNTASDVSNFTYWSIVLEESTNNIYIVDNRTGGYTGNNKVSAGVQISATNAVSVATSPDLLSLAAGDPTSADNTYYTFKQGTQAAYDMSATSVTTASFVVAGNTTVSGTIRNLGSATINNYIINYKVDNGATVSAPITAQSIAPLASANFTHTTPWNASIGTHTVEVWATSINGNADANTADDSKIKTINVLSALVQRVPLFEIFTSSTCAPCTPGNTNFHSVVDDENQASFVAIKYQQNFPGTGDPYATAEAVNRRTNMYAVTSIPRMEIDGGWNQNASSFTQALYSNAVANPAQYELNGTYFVNDFNKTVLANLKFAPLYNSTGARLYVAIIENKTTANVKSNGETEFKQVMKKMIPNETGTLLAAKNAGVWDSLKVSYTFNGNYKLPVDGATANQINHTIEHSVEEFTDLRVVAWIQSTGADKQVYQAYNLLSTPTNINSVESIAKYIKIYPNPASDKISINYAANKIENLLITLIGNNGNIIKALDKNVSIGNNTISISTQDIVDGIYYLSIIDSKNNSHTQAVTIKK